MRAAFHLIATKGLEGLRTRDIAAEVGINISTLHYHFENKEALIAAVVEHVTGLFKTTHAPLPADATPLDELKLLFGGPAYRRRTDSQVDAVVQEIMLRSRLDKQVRKAFESMMSSWRNAVESIVERCIRAGQLRADLDPRTVAAIITSMQVGANVQLGIAPNAFSLDRAGRDLISWLR